MGESMKNRFYRIAIVAFLLATSNVYSNQNDLNENIAGRWVTVTGLGNLSSGKDVAKRSALLAAYRKAVNEGGSVEITEFSQLRNFKDVVDIVTKKSRGVIKSYTVENEGIDVKDSDYYQVTIKALVVDKTDVSADDSEELRQFVTMIGSPRILIVVGEQEVNNNDWSKSPSQNTVEEVIASQFNQVGFQVATSADLIGKKGVDSQTINLARQGISVYAEKLGKIAKADLVVTGLAEYQLSAMNGGTDVSAKLGVAGLSAKVFIPGVGRVLHISNSSQRYMSVQAGLDNSAKAKSISQAAKIVGEDLRKAVPDILAKETRDIQITIKKIDYAKAQSIVEYIKGLEGVDDIELVNWNKGDGAEYKVKNAFTGPREQDYAKLITSKFKNIKVESLNSYSLVFSL